MNVNFFLIRKKLNMVNTFIIADEPIKCAKLLDYRRLGKQPGEAIRYILFTFICRLVSKYRFMNENPFSVGSIMSAR